MLLPADMAIHADMAKERDQLFVAAEVAVQAALDMVAVCVDPGGGLAAEHIALLDQLNIDAGVEQLDGGRQAKPARHLR